MQINDPVILELLRRSMVARIATLSRSGRPSVNPLYFIYHNGKIWLGTADWTLAARNVEANPDATVLFQLERDPSYCWILRVRGPARVCVDAQTMRTYNLRVAIKYLLSLGGMRDNLMHLRLLGAQRSYRAQSARKGQSCVIEVIPEQAELLLSEDVRC